MKLSRVSPARRAVQWVAAAIVLAVGVQFTLWVHAHLRGEMPTVPRPPAVEAFLPIDAMLSLRHLLASGIVDSVHPAGLAIFLGICLMSATLARSFCSHLCPVGLASELSGRIGARLMGRNLRLPRWLDLGLRSLKLLLLGFFVWAIWWAMDLAAVADFKTSPYARVADAKMWLFFASPSRLTIAVLGILTVGSFFVRDLWCRYLCPYGALLGVLGRLAPLKVARDPSLCTDCGACTRACPARLDVHTSRRVTSIECTGCMDCVVACPVSGCLTVRPPLVTAGRRWLRPAVAVAMAVTVYATVVGGFALAGHWRTEITEAEYHHRLREIHSPRYGHPGAGGFRQASGSQRPRASGPGVVTMVP
jgi:polyferredoxin